LLPNDPKAVAELGLKRNAANYRKNIIDEKSINFKKHGQFEIFIPAEKFPYKGSHKSGYIILRMPQTLVENECSDYSKDPKRYDYVAEKQDLYNRIKAMKESGKGGVEVIIELNYVRVKTKDPLELELTQPNVFFRTAYGRYIDYVGQLYSSKPRINKELFKRISDK
jgi:hypothetical protein